MNFSITSLYVGPCWKRSLVGTIEKISEKQNPVEKVGPCRSGTLLKKWDTGEKVVSDRNYHYFIFVTIEYTLGSNQECLETNNFF